MKEKGKCALNEVVISLGSNLDPEFNIPEALLYLARYVTIIRTAPIYETPAYGSEGPNYLNSAVLINTELSLALLKKEVLAPIENQLGRIRSADKYMDRTIDLDVLIFNQLVIDPELWTQAHIAVPAAQVFPDYSNPETGEKISQAAKRLLPGIDIKKRSDLSNPN